MANEEKDNLEQSLNDNLMLVLEEIGSLQEKFDTLIGGQEEMNAAIDDQTAALEEMPEKGKAPASASAPPAQSSAKPQAPKAPAAEKPALAKEDLSQLKDFSENAKAFMDKSTKMMDEQATLSDTLKEDTQTPAESTPSQGATSNAMPPEMDQEEWNPALWNKTAEMVLGEGATAISANELTRNEPANSERLVQSKPPMNAKLQIRGGSINEARQKISDSVTRRVASQI